ncbi:MULTISPECIES: methyl-accepting chemotaxis protein [unclassified Azospirillum]|uniref:methyl-accepting chemotaxis protein n=1 Tax=unclassified Azospirillum TaxID=2630922 RepID=UPI000B65B8F5|nr:MULTISPECIES: methyl-accepting chemotaxis protein [unclassified Azospirillum]SNR83877.1 methyl-accepting chemotaxis sensory transducer with Pas/Pac sensor [Azospirillum sp. RU38E]SNR99456.1 methyl-accepting chemotaxis sensory transducer with Pas/Pac sensor [Azospirillum sp. RU37A]
MAEQEWLVSAEDVLVSRTDPQGRIQFANEAFVKASGFTQAELIGRPHNIVRHPDMPKPAFADLWTTIKAGRPWEGLVKNRRKDGRFYWVRANVTPVVEGGTVTGFLSVRTRPERADVAAAEQLYAAMRRGDALSVRLHHGELRPTRLAGRLGLFWRSIGSRLHGAFLGMFLAMAGLGGIGLVGLSRLRGDLTGAQPDVAAALARIEGLNGDFIALGVVALLFSVLAGWLLRLSIRAPLARLCQHLEAITRDPRSHTIEPAAILEFAPVTDRLRVLRARLACSAEEAAECERRVSAERQRAVQMMAATVERESARAVTDVAARTHAMTDDADILASRAGRVGEASGGVAAAAEQALANAQAVAAATEELSATIHDIAAQITHASDSTGAAVAQGHDVACVIETLRQQVDGIGEMAALIAQIASQTNLLALNASIEAARAGEAGKGFAVVAGEVKHLATLTAQSTDAITTRIQDIRRATGDAVQAVEGIGSRIAEIDAIAGDIAGAMQQQAAATREISRNVQETTAAAREVAELIGDVAREAAESGSQAQMVSGNATAVAGAIEELHKLLVRVVRTATPDADRRGARRYNVDIPCETRLEGAAAQPARLVDLSAGGASLSGLALEPEARGQVILPRIGQPLGFRVRGKSATLAHIVFDQPLPEPVLTALAAE